MSYKRKPTRYPNIYEYYTQKGKRYAVRIGYSEHGKKKEFSKTGIKTLTAARSLLRNIEEKIDNEEIGLVKNKNITVAEYYSIFRKEKLESKVWNKTSASGYDSAFTNHLLPKFGNFKLRKLDRTIYQRFINEKLNEITSHGRKRSVESVRSINNSFMSMLNHAVDVGVIERNRMKRIVISDFDYQPKKKHLTLDEYKEFMKVAEEELKNKMDFAMVYLTTFGLRRGEIMGLTPKYIDFRPEDGCALLTIKKTRTLDYPDGKGTKTKSSERMIVIDDEGTDLLKYTINEAREIRKDFGEILHESDFIFINQRNGEPYYVGRLNALMTRISKKSNIKCNPHMMRHTFATYATVEGINDRILSDYLGHKTASMTEQYKHQTAEGMDKVISISNQLTHK